MVFQELIPNQEGIFTHKLFANSAKGLGSVMHVMVRESELFDEISFQYFDCFIVNLSNLGFLIGCT